MNHTLKVTGMTCGHCEAAVREAILAVDPTATVAIDRAAGRVEVVSSVDTTHLIEAITAEGYGVTA
ncbi:MAG: heavy-metal-associated domain-containing protein [Casimicrobiaceae bacterium]